MLQGGLLSLIFEFYHLEPSKFYKSMKDRLFIKTFGCQMNVYDSEKVAGLLASNYRLVASAEEADLIFLNTCSVRDKAEHKLFSLIGSLRALKDLNPALLIGVGGCVAQQEGEALLKRCREVDFVVGTHNLSLVPSLIEGIRKTGLRQVAIDYRDEWEDLPLELLPSAEETIREDTSPLLGLAENQVVEEQPWSPVRALVAIQRGCDKSCAFCVVPGTRGPEVSRDPKEVLREVKYKVSVGAREVVLLGQTVNSYGKGLASKYTFSDLVRDVARIEGVKRIRFTSPHPQDMKDDLIALYAEVPELMPHVHLPLQSGSDRILKAMNRNYRVRRYMEIVDALKKANEKIAITTDLIVGFPSETEADFRATLEVMSQVRYHHSFSFSYSRRPHTAAESRYKLDEEIDENVKSERLQRLQELQHEISSEINSEILGEVVEVLVEGQDKAISSTPRGRIPQNTLVEIVGGGVKPGSLVSVRITNAAPYGLRGEVLSLEK